MSEQTKLLHIPLKNIRENPVALRPVDKSAEAYLQLVDSIKKNGVLNPINVREIPNPDPNGEQLYSVMDGLHRFTASGDAGKETIPAQVINKTDAEVEEAQIIANVQKIETKPAQYSKQLNRIVLRNPDLTLAELASRLSRGPQWLAERLTIVKLKEEYQKLVDDGRITVTNAISLAKLPPEMQADFLERAMTQSPGDFLPAINTAVKQHRDALRAGKDPNAPKVFEPTVKLQKTTDIKEVLANPEPVAKELISLAQPKGLVEAFALGVQWCMNSDPKSVATQKAQWEKEQAENAARKAREKQAREELKARLTKETADAANKAAEGQPAAA